MMMCCLAAWLLHGFRGITRKPQGSFILLAQLYSQEAGTEKWEFCSTIATENV